MKRVIQQPRTDWRERVENLGLSYHTIDGEVYWDETASYQFVSSQIAQLEKVTRDLQAMSVTAAERAIRENWRSRMGITEAAWKEIVDSWERDDLSLYGRFDLIWDGTSDPKMLEYNADTPTGLLEASVVQWQWKEEVCPNDDQFNSIHELLLASWPAWESDTFHFCAQREAEEDWRTVIYLMDTCRQSGKTTFDFAIEDLGWKDAAQCFVDDEDRTFSRLFKLYPWEWMWTEPFSQHLPGRCDRFVEPVWKMLWSNKAFLVLMWETFEGHPNLLKADFHPMMLGGSYAAKPFFGREGSNVKLVERGNVIQATEGPWGDQPMVYQDLHPEVSFAGNHPVIGSWVVGGEPGGIGIREDQGRVTANGSRFVPHSFRS